MAGFTFERLVSRNVVRYVSEELDLSGIKMGVNTFVEIAILGFFLLFILIPVFCILVLNLGSTLGATLGLIAGVGYETALYILLEYYIEKRKNFVEQLLPDYLQLVAANIRSGIALERALLLARRPEFGFFSADIELINKQLYSGETLQNALDNLAKMYRSTQLKHTIRMILEAVRYGGALADLLNQIAKDLRSQQTIQKEIAGQLFMYTIFIVFAALIASPMLYGLTLQMITITDKVWAGILQQNPGGLPTTGISFLKPSPPQISPTSYFYFAVVAIIITTSLSSFTVSAITSGEAIRGMRYLPVFVVTGLIVFYLVTIVMGTVFSGLGGVM